MAGKAAGTLVIIGGHEDKEGDKVILAEVARRVGAGKLVVAAVASQLPDELFAEYDGVFRGLGVRHVYKLPIETREDALEAAKLRVMDDAVGVFFTGGDQLRITSLLGGTPIVERLHEIYRDGGVVAGTSAGASAVCETMLVSGRSGESYRLGDAVQMAPGLGLIEGVVIDQHFAERGRVGRLLGAVAHNPTNLGLGIDEDTAVVVERGRTFYVLGAGGVYVLDAAGVSHSNLAAGGDATLSMYDVTLHVLSQGDRFDLRERRPGRLSGRAAERLPEKEPEAAAKEE